MRRHTILGLLALGVVASCGARSELRIPSCNDLDAGAAVTVVHTWPPPGVLVPLPSIPLLPGGTITDGTYTVNQAIELSTRDAGSSQLAATIVVRDGVIQSAVRRDNEPLVRGTYTYRLEAERVILTPTCGSGLPPFNNFEADNMTLAMSSAVGATTDIAIWELRSR